MPPTPHPTPHPTYVVTYMDRETGELLSLQRLGNGCRYSRDPGTAADRPLVIEFDWGYFPTGPITVDVENELGAPWTAYAGPRRDGDE